MRDKMFLSLRLRSSGESGRRGDWDQATESYCTARTLPRGDHPGAGGQSPDAVLGAAARARAGDASDKDAILTKQRPLPILASHRRAALAQPNSEQKDILVRIHFVRRENCRASQLGSSDSVCDLLWPFCSCSPRCNATASTLTLHVQFVGHTPLKYINNGEAIPRVILYGLVRMGEPLVIPPKSRKPLENLSDTPFVHKATRDISHLSETLPTSRQTVIGDLGNAIPEVPVSFFFESVCPRISSRDDKLVDKVLNRLTTGSNKVTDDETGQWADFVTLPSASLKHEDPTFQPLEGLIKAIGDAAAHEDPSYKSNLVFQNSPYTSPVSTHWNSASPPDGYFRVCGPGKKPHWKDIALCAEYKKYNMKDSEDDVSAVCPLCDCGY